MQEFAIHSAIRTVSESDSTRAKFFYFPYIASGVINDTEEKGYVLYIVFWELLCALIRIETFKVAYVREVLEALRL